MTRQTFAPAEHSRARISGLVPLLGTVLGVAAVAPVGIRCDEWEGVRATLRWPREVP